MNEKQLDQFYTKKEISKMLMDKINKYFNLNNYFLLEPSAGKGSFSDLFHSNSQSFDIDPKNENIIKKDFLEIKIDEIENKNKQIFTIGNPPFGKNSSLALKFINKSAEFSQYIGFILPKTFKKKSFVDRINNKLHLLMEFELPEKSFIFKGNEYNVPCVFQIWEKKDIKREKSKLIRESNFFKFEKKENADFAIRRVGGLAGKVILDFESYKPTSNYYISIINKEYKEKIIKIMIQSYKDFQSVAKNTAGNPSLSKSEIISILEIKLKKEINTL